MSQHNLRNAARILLLALSATAAGASHAHHSFAAQYDSNKPVKMAGVVTKVEWTNPHVYLYIDVKDKAGKVTNWGFEMGPPHMLQRTGWKKNSLSIGEQVAIEGWLARDGSNHANARRVTRVATGEVLGAASSAGQTLTGGAGAGAAAPGAGPIGSSQVTPPPAKPAAR
jgi:uncharacterized protein DUF6152